MAASNSFQTVDLLGASFQPTVIPWLMVHGFAVVTMGLTWAGTIMLMTNYTV